LRIPVAYRLDIITKRVRQDPFQSSKFGGLPNPQSIHRNKLKAMAENWPRCSVCRTPMAFTGQVHVSDWLIAIHQCTYQGIKDDGKRDQRRSALGHSHFINKFTPDLNMWFYFWHCADNHILTWCPDALCRGIWIRTPTPSPNWSIADLRKAIPRIPRGILGKIPLEIVTEIKLKFDIDDPQKYSRRDDTWDRIDKVENLYPELFSHEGRYQLFGAPRSQQQEPRYCCINSYPEPHRMGPLLNWNHHSDDMTHQMYGCIPCGNTEGIDLYIYAKMDHSCT
jgi:hypothetical protein